MLIEGQMITIRINNKNQGHFQSLGYDVKFGDIILVPPEHLKRSSPAIVKVRCDIPECDNVMEKSYSTYLLQHTYDMDVCVQHRKEKAKLTNIEKYGTEWGFQNEKVQKKIEATNIKKYGCKNPSSAEAIRIKVKQTNLQKYGVEFVSKLVEYDGSYWHQDKQRDLKRDKFLQSQGFKALRIRSGHLLPDEDELFSAIDYLTTTDHCFKEIILSDWKEVDKNESLFDSTAI